MSEPSPESPPEPAVPGHIEAWISRHVAPDLAAVKADAERFREALPAVASMARAVAWLAQAVPAPTPEGAALVADAVKAAEAMARIAGDLSATGM
jgi:hypothetical protein